MRLYVLQISEFSCSNSMHLCFSVELCKKNNVDSKAKVSPEKLIRRCVEPFGCLIPSGVAGNRASIKVTTPFELHDAVQK